MKFLYSIILMALIIPAFSANGQHLAVKVNKGETLFGILSQYDLYTNKCNVDAFYAINEMKNGDHIKAGLTYELPLRVFDYNGESIRSTIGNDNWDLAVAIQEYNKQLKENDAKPSYYTEDKKLFVPYHLVGCDNVTIPKAGETKTVVKPAAPKIEYINTDIYFGGENKIKKESDKLKGRVFYIISGHGGPDPGAMGKKAGKHLCEDEYAYDVSLRLAKNLLINGATVHMIIQDKNDGIRDGSYLGVDKDEVCKLKGTIPLNQTKRLRQRADAVNELYKKDKKKGYKDYTAIAIHVDSRSTSLKQDVFFYYAPGSNTGKKKALAIQDTFREKYEIHQKGRGYNGSVTERNLYVLRKTNPPAVYVELANIQNTENHKRILPHSNRQVLANWLYEGLIK